MVKNIQAIADRLGATVVGQIPETGAGAFGAARLAAISEMLQTRLKPGQGKRAGRPTNPTWQRHPKVPMSEATAIKLAKLAQHASTSGRQVSPMQLAAQLLEEIVATLPDE